MFCAEKQNVLSDKTKCSAPKNRMFYPVKQKSRAAQKTEPHGRKSTC